MINSHPSLSTISGQNRSIPRPFSGAFLNVFGMIPALQTSNKSPEIVNPAQKRRFIKPNKNGDLQRQHPTILIAATPRGATAVALAKCRICCFKATRKRGLKMVLTFVIISMTCAAIIAPLALLIAVHRAFEVIYQNRREEDEQ